jgi:hypothetical protein
VSIRLSNLFPDLSGTMLLGRIDFIAKLLYIL